MNTSTRRRQRAGVLLVPAAGLAGALLLGGCGEGSISLPTVSVSLPSTIPTELPTTLPSVTLPSLPTEEPTDEATEEPSAEPTEEPTTEPTPEPTQEPTQESTAPEPTPTRTAVVTETVTPTPTAPETPTPTPSPSTTDSALGPASDEAQGASPMLWWLLGGAALAALLAAVLVPRSRRRAAWDADLASAEADMGWLARELLPQLQGVGTVEALAGAWQVSVARVAELEDRLTGLEGSAPDETRAAGARQRRDAVRDARRTVEQLIASGDLTPSVGWLGAAVAQLEGSFTPVTAR